MDNAINKYKQRRDARLKKRMDEEWITMKGTHVLIDDEGQVSKGPSTLKSLVEKSGGHKKKSGVTDLRKPGSANMNKGPNSPSAGEYMETLEKGGMKAKSPDDTKRAREKNVGKGTIERGIEDEKEDFWVREVRGKIEDCVKRVKEKTGYVKMWQELETDLYLVPDGTSVKVGDIVYTKGTDKYGDNGWLFTNEFGRKEGLVYNWTDGRFADEIARAIRGGKSSTIVVKQKGKSSEADIARERMIERGKNGGEAPGTEKKSYEKIPLVFSIGGSQYATPEEKKKRREIISGFMNDAKEGDVYSVGGGVGSSGGSRFKVTKSRGKLALQWENSRYKPVEMSRTNVEKFLKNGATLVKRG